MPILGLLLAIKHNLCVKKCEHALNMDAATHTLKKTRRGDTNIIPLRPETDERGGDGSDVCVCERAVWDGAPPPGILDLTPVFLFVSVRASSALHLCPNQSTGLRLPPGPTLSLTCGTQAKVQDCLCATKRWRRPGPRKHTLICRERINSEKIFFFFLEDVDLFGLEKDCSEKVSN